MDVKGRLGYGAAVWVTVMKVGLLTENCLLFLMNINDRSTSS